MGQHILDFLLTGIFAVNVNSNSKILGSFSLQTRVFAKTAVHQPCHETIQWLEMYLSMHLLSLILDLDSWRPEACRSYVWGRTLTRSAIVSGPAQCHPVPRLNPVIPELIPSIQDIEFLTNLRHEQEINFQSHKDTGPGPNGDLSSCSTAFSVLLAAVCVCVTLRNCGTLSPSCPVECQSVL